jgi:hypothetical protein
MLSAAGKVLYCIKIPPDGQIGIEKPTDFAQIRPASRAKPGAGRVTRTSDSSRSERGSFNIEPTATVQEGGFPSPLAPGSTTGAAVQLPHQRTCPFQIGDR